MGQSKNPYANQGDSRDTPARQKLVALRQALLRLHKTLLEMERRHYEKIHGFQKQYFDSIQRDPTVVMEHAELARLFNNEPPDKDGA